MSGSRATRCAGYSEAIPTSKSWERHDADEAETDDVGWAGCPFLDVQMPGCSGFELLERLDEITLVVFTTAYDRFALKAFEVSALDYLLKPINPIELKEAITRFQQQKDKKEVYSKQLENFLSNAKEKNLAITTYDGVVFLEVDKIIRCEADLNYTKFVLTDNKTFLSSKTLKDYEDLLTSSNNFLRVHRSHLVNLDFVLKFKNEGGLILKDNSTIPVSRRRKEEVMARLNT